MILPATAPRARLCTIFGTVVYLDEPSNSLRHGAADGSPANIAVTGNRALLAESRGGWLIRAGDGSIYSFAAGPDRSPEEADAAPRGATLFDIIPLEDGSVALRAEGRYLGAEPDGRVAHLRYERDPGEHFRLVDPGLPPDACAALGTLALFPGPVARRYHLGCGPNLIPGYVNIDEFDNVAGGTVHRDFKGIKGADFINHDLSTGIPAADNSLEAIYHCHFLEHLDYRDGINLLRQARFRLKPGGLMRVVVPDLELWVDNYRRDRSGFFAAYRQAALGGNTGSYRTKGSVFSGMLYNFGHRCAYDFETIGWLLRELGFANIRRTAFREGRLPDLLIGEPNTPLRALESLCVECEKPLA